MTASNYQNREVRGVGGLSANRRWERCKGAVFRWVGGLGANEEAARRFRSTTTYRVFETVVYVGWLYFRAFIATGLLYLLVVFLSASGVEFSALSSSLLFIALVCWVFKPVLMDESGGIR